MKKFVPLLVASVALALGACNPAETPSAPSEAAAKPETPATPTAHKVWTTDSGGTDGRARLMFAEAGASAYSVKFECPANGPVYVYPGLKPPAGATAFPFVLESVGPINGGVYAGEVIAAVPSNSFTLIRSTGVVSVSEPDKAPVKADAGTPEEKAMFDQFFKACGT